MPSVSIHRCRAMVCDRKPFMASTLHGKWTTSSDGTDLYVVTSEMKRRTWDRFGVVLFVWDGVKWYESKDIPHSNHHRRVRQMYYARPLPQREMLRVDRADLQRFVRNGLADHPDMTRLLEVSV